jgi:hypothetical protein
MKLSNFPETIIDWSQVPISESIAASGSASTRTCQAGETQLRIVEYSSGYLADHWCTKGHLIYVISGAITIEHQNERKPFKLSVGMSWQVADDAHPPHRVRSEFGACVFIVD